MKKKGDASPNLSRRAVVQTALAGGALLSVPAGVRATLARDEDTAEAGKRFPYFLSTPVPYFRVTMQDSLWAPRQTVIREVTLPWATHHWDASGGLEEFRGEPGAYRARIQRGDMEALKFIEAMAAVVGLKRDPAIEGLAEAWGQELIDAQLPDGYAPFGWPRGADPAWRWKPYWYSHEDYALGHYLEAAIAYRESTGRDAMYQSAVRAVDNMAQAFLGTSRAYAPGHEEIEQALMRLYGVTGEKKYLRLCGWLIEQRGYHEGRPNFGRYSQDHLPVGEQRTIEGHAVRAAYLFNGVTQYVGATGDVRYREAVLAVWDDFVNHKMYLHGAGGNESAHNEGYSPRSDFIPPHDCYGESCSVVGNFHWAHSLFRLTGEAGYLDVAERMLYNAFYASLSLQGDRYFYRNMLAQDTPQLRFAWHPVPCCPPNIVKLLAKVGGFFYSIDPRGIFVKHYGASSASIPFARGVRLTQRTGYPWSGDIAIQVEPARPTEFDLRLRVPRWAKTYSVSVNGRRIDMQTNKGWLTLRRHWKPGDVAELHLPMEVERVTLPARFKEYTDLAAIQRGPMVYCLEEQDSPAAFYQLYVPQEISFEPDSRPAFLGGITVLETSLPRVNFSDGTESSAPVMLVPYALWNNREPGAMTVWLASRKRELSELLPPDKPPGDD